MGIKLPRLNKTTILSTITFKNIAYAGLDGIMMYDCGGDCDCDCSDDFSGDCDCEYGYASNNDCSGDCDCDCSDCDDCDGDCDC